MRSRWSILVILATLVVGGCESADIDRLRHVLEETRAELTATRRELATSERARKAVSRRLEKARRQLAAARSRKPGEEGLVVAIPLLGSLTWRCNDDREFAFTFVPDAASVMVQHSIDGRVTKKVLHPGDELAGPFLPPDVHQEWGITYRHEPADISAGIFVVPGVRQGMCLIRDFTVDQSRSR